MKKINLCALLTSLLVITGCNNQTNGLKTEKEWENASSVISYGTKNKANVELYKGDNALYAYFHIIDEDIQTVGNTNGDDVTQSDSVEIYFDFRNDGAEKPQSDDIQINISANGRTRIFVGNNGSWGSWNGLLDFAVNVNGTLNSEETSKDVDTGYDVEIMIPYAQVGIEKSSTFGLAVGCVSRGVDSTSSTLDYTWEGLTYDGVFIDPQKPAGYIIFMNNQFYSKANVPMDNVTLKGTVYNQKKEVVSNATVSLGDITVTTDEKGQYTINNVDPNNDQKIEISKNGSTTNEETLKSTFLRETLTKEVTKDFILVDSNITFKSKITGVVKNPADGIIENAKVVVDEQTLYTNANGEFECEVVVDGDVDLLVSKATYKNSVSKIDALSIAGNATYDLQTVALYSPSSSFVFGGARNTTLVNAEVYRGFEGINFTFTTNANMTNGDHIQLFIDSQYSMVGNRDNTDYRIDFDGDGSINIVNFGNGTNTAVGKSGIKNNAYQSGVLYYIEAFIPYEFLGVEATDIIGFSCGSFDAGANDWDGFVFPQDGFADYVAPEMADQYVRIGLDNSLYRAIGNEIVAKRIYGTVKNQSGNVLTNATVNGQNVKEDGTYVIYSVSNDTTTLKVTCPGYITQTISVNLSSSNIVTQDIVMVLAEAPLTVTVKDQSDNGLDGVKVTVKEHPEIVVTTTNGVASFTVPTGAHITLVFEKDGYTKLEKRVANTALENSANTGIAYTVNVILQLA